jgi:ketosteroid isomerase-like protein
MITPAEVMAAYEAAADQHDLEATMSLVDDDAVYFFSNETTHIGRAAVRAAIARNFEAITMERFELDHLEAIVETEAVAVFLYEFRWSGIVDGEDRSGSGRGTTVLVSSGDSWHILHEHLSRGPYKLA